MNPVKTKDAILQHGEQGRLPRESGVVLVLVALLLVAIFAALAFAVDIGRLAVGQAEYKRSAAAAALSALSSHWHTGMTSTGKFTARYAQAVDAAKTAATSISSVSENEPVFSVASGDPRLIDVGNSWEYAPDIDSGGIIRYGFWHFREPPGGCASQPKNPPNFDPMCPCHEKKWIEPCFERQNPARRHEFATAVQVEIFTPLSSPFRWAFAQTFGALPIGIRARATASLASEGEVISAPRLVENILLPPYARASDADAFGSKTVKVRSLGPELEQPRPTPLQLEPPQEKPIEPENKKPTECVPGTQEWNIAGRYELFIPASCSEFLVWGWGAGGAGSQKFNGGAGGFARGSFERNSTGRYTVEVGRGGHPSCVAAASEGTRSGGGLSALFEEETPLLVAGGGGAAGDLPEPIGCPASANGGAGGGLEGLDGEGGTCLGAVAEGGKSDRGGSGAPKVMGLNGTYLVGGDQSGGHGYFGGGGTASNSGGAGGGSGYVSANAEDTALEPGQGAKPPKTSDSNYHAPASEGGMSGCKTPEGVGKDGLVIVKWQ